MWHLYSDVGFLPRCNIAVLKSRIHARTKVKVYCLLRQVRVASEITTLSACSSYSGATTIASWIWTLGIDSRYPRSFSAVRGLRERSVGPKEEARVRGQAAKLRQRCHEPIASVVLPGFTVLFVYSCCGSWSIFAQVLLKKYRMNACSSMSKRHWTFDHIGPTSRILLLLSGTSTTRP